MNNDIKKLEIQLEFVNFKGLENQEIKLQGSNLYFIEGKNKMGKSSIIHGIIALLEAKNNIKEAIKTGEKKGKVRGRLPGPNGEIYSINMEITPSATSFTMVKPNGDVLTKVTEMRKILQYNSLNVNDFVNLSHTADGRKKQISIIINLLPEDIKNKFLLNMKEIDPTNGSVFLKRKTAKANYERQFNIYDNISIPESLEKEGAENLENLEKERNKTSETLKSNKEIIEKEKVTLSSLQANDNGIKLEKENFEKFVNEEADEEINEIKLKISELEQSLLDIEEKKKEAITGIEERKEYLIVSGKKIEEKEKSISDMIEKNEELETKYSELNRKCGVADAYKDQIKKKKEVKETLDEFEKAYNKAEKELTDLRAENESIIQKSDLNKYNINIKDGYIHVGEFIMDENQVCKSDLMLTLLPILIKSNKCPIVTMSDGESLDDNNILKFIDIVKENEVIAFMDRVNNDYEELTLTGFEKTSDVEITFLEKTEDDDEPENKDEEPYRPSFI